MMEAEKVMVAEKVVEVVLYKMMRTKLNKSISSIVNI